MSPEQLAFAAAGLSLSTYKQLTELQDPSEVGLLRLLRESLIAHGRAGVAFEALVPVGTMYAVSLHLCLCCVGVRMELLPLRGSARILALNPCFFQEQLLFDSRWLGFGDGVWLINPQAPTPTEVRPGPHNNVM